MATNGWYKLESSQPVGGSKGQHRGKTERVPDKGGMMRSPAGLSRPIPPEKQPVRETPVPLPARDVPPIVAEPLPLALGEIPVVPVQEAPPPAVQQAPSTAPQQAAPPPMAQQRPARPQGEVKPLPVPPSTPVEDHSSTLHSQTVGDRGPVLRHDTVLHETLDTFVTSKRVERAVHVKGFGAFGTFQTTNSMAEYTKASIFQTPGQQTPVLTRFSLAVSTKGTPDTGRNVRGFSTKFYCDGGPFDLLCNHIPVFLVRDAIRFPDSIKAFLPSPVNNLADPNRFWGFVATAPEATHFVTWLYSDVGTIKSLRKIRASSVNTYVWCNAKGMRRLVKYHWIPLAGEEYIDRGEAARLAGENPDTCGQDLWNSIQQGKPAEYQLCVQLMELDEVAHLPFDPLDDTKTWDEEEYPLLPVGRLTLNRNPDNYNEQIERVAFSPANLLEGIELSDDKMLQGRSTVYWDAQRYRLGPDFRRIPVNKSADFDPDRLVSSGIGQHLDGRELRADLAKMDDFAQAGMRYLSLSSEQQAHLVDNIASDLYVVKQEIGTTVLGFLRQANEEMAQRVAQQMAVYAGK